MTLAGFELIQPCLPKELWRLALEYADTTGAARALRFLGNLLDTDEILWYAKRLRALFASYNPHIFSLRPKKMLKEIENIAAKIFHPKAPVNPLSRITPLNLLLQLTQRCQDYLGIYDPEHSLDLEKAKWMREHVMFYQPVYFGDNRSHSKAFALIQMSNVYPTSIALSLDVMGELEPETFSYSARPNPASLSAMLRRVSSLRRLGFAPNTTWGNEATVTDFSQKFPQIGVIEAFWADPTDTPIFCLLEHSFRVHSLFTHLNPAHPPTRPPEKTLIQYYPLAQNNYYLDFFP